MNEIPRSDSSLLLHYIVKAGVDILGLTRCDQQQNHFAIFSEDHSFDFLLSEKIFSSSLARDYHGRIIFQNVSSVA